jgi:hypothetical protein
LRERRRREAAGCSSCAVGLAGVRHSPCSLPSGSVPSGGLPLPHAPHTICTTCYLYLNTTLLPLHTHLWAPTLPLTWVYALAYRACACVSPWLSTICTLHATLPYLYCSPFICSRAARGQCLQKRHRYCSAMTGWMFHLDLYFISGPTAF